MTRLFRPDSWRRFARRTEGSVAVQAALLLLLMLGFISLGVEVSQMLLEQRKQQSVADSAAVAAAAAATAGVSDLQTEAKGVAASLGYKDGTNSVTVTAAKPPTTGAHAGDAKYVEVKVTRTFTPGLMQLFRKGNFTVQARAVAQLGQTSPCLLVLGSSGTTLQLGNNASMAFTGCGAFVNSSSSSAVDLGNNATLSGNVTIVGGVDGSTSGATITKTATPAADPYSGISFTASGKSRSGTSAGHLTPGIYKNGWNFGNNSKATLAPGTYFIRSQFSLGNDVTIEGTGVTIVFDGNYAVSAGNNVTFSLTPGASGLVFYSASDNNSAFSIGNNATLDVTGAIYLPSRVAQFGNNTVTSSTACAQMLARLITLGNDSAVTLKTSCSGGSSSQYGGLAE